MMKQLETANKTILELGMKGAALQKELDMHKEFEKLNVNHAVALAKADWEHQTHQLEELAALAGRVEAPPPEAKPPPAPGFEAAQLGPKAAAQGIIFHPPKAAAEAEVQKQDPWAVAVSTPKVTPQPVSAAHDAGMQASRSEEVFGVPGVRQAAALRRERRHLAELVQILQAVSVHQRPALG